MYYTKNSNSKIVYKLAKRSIRENRGRNIAAISTIALSACIVLTLVLVTLGVYRSNYNLVKDAHQATIRNVNEQDIVSLSADDRLSKIGIMYWLDHLERTDGDISYLYYNDTLLAESFSGMINGNYPIDENEILVTQSYLDFTGQNIKIGDSLNMNSYDIDGLFTVTGIIDDTDIEKDTAYVFFSQEFVQGINEGGNLEYTAYLWLENVTNFSENEIKQVFNQIREESGIESAQIYYNSAYFAYTGQFLNPEDVTGITLISCLVLIAAAIVVYTIFYISVGNKIREYGQLRTLGATQKQIKKIISYESRILAVVGAAIGILISWGIGYVMKSDGWYWVHTLIASAAVLLFEIFVVGLSVRTPAKMAKSASPIEAGKYSSYSYKTSKRSEERRKKTSPVRLSTLNILRSPKKTVLIILSLGLCGVLFVCASSLQENVTAERMVRIEEFKYGNFILNVIGDENHTYSQIQQLNNPLTDLLREQIFDIDGVKGIHKEIMVNGTALELNDTWNLYGFALNDVKGFEASLIEGTLDYETLTQNKGLLVYLSDDLEKFYDWTPQLGDTVTFSTLKGDGDYVETTLTVMGLLEDHNNLAGHFSVTENTLQQITGTSCYDSWEIITDTSKDVTIEQKLRSIIQDNPHIQLSTYAETVETRQAEFDLGWGMVFVLALLLGAFGIINLINTNAANMFSRKHEIGILQAVGMTKKQVRTSLFFEGFINTVVATVITIVIGLPLGYFICGFINESIIKIYEIPWQAPVTYFVSLLVVQLILTLYNVTMLSKEPVIKRLSIYL